MPLGGSKSMSTGHVCHNWSFSGSMTSIEDPDLNKPPRWWTKQTYSNANKPEPLGFCAIDRSALYPVKSILQSLVAAFLSPQLKGWSTIATTLLQTKIQQVIPIPPKATEAHVRGCSGNTFVTINPTHREEGTNSDCWGVSEGAHQTTDDSQGALCTKLDHPKQWVGAVLPSLSCQPCQNTLCHYFFFTSQKSIIKLVSSDSHL